MTKLGSTYTDCISVSWPILSIVSIILNESIPKPQSNQEHIRAATKEVVKTSCFHCPVLLPIERIRRQTTRQAISVC